MWSDRVSNPGPLTYKSDALPTALQGPAPELFVSMSDILAFKAPKMKVDEFANSIDPYQVAHHEQPHPI